MIRHLFKDEKGHLHFTYIVPLGGIGGILLIGAVIYIIVMIATTATKPATTNAAQFPAQRAITSKEETVLAQAASAKLPAQWSQYTAIDNAPISLGICYLLDREYYQLVDGFDANGVTFKPSSGNNKLLVFGFQEMLKDQNGVDNTLKFLFTAKGTKVTSPLYPLMTGTYKGNQVAASTLKYVSPYTGEYNNNPRTPPDANGTTTKAPLYQCEGKLAFEVPASIKGKNIYLAVFNNDLSTVAVFSVN